MADEQGLTGDRKLADGEFARKKTGDRVKAAVANLGPAGRQFVPQDGPPANPENGDTYLADGANWNPAGTGNAALVTHIAGSWEVVNEFSTGL